jgi:hypothetical protein
MDKTFPPQFRRIMSDPSVKKVWVSDHIAERPDLCPNCGGVGTFNIFTALEGPYPQPCNPNSRYSEGVYKISKSDIIKGHVMWWGGRSYDFPCPVCKGSGQTIGG